MDTSLVLVNNPLTGSTVSLGHFIFEPVFLKLYERLAATRANAQSSVSFNFNDKFTQMRAICFEVTLQGCCKVYHHAHQILDSGYCSGKHRQQRGSLR